LDLSQSRLPPVTESASCVAARFYSFFCDPGIPGTFGLIGECYVRGLMKGEIMQSGRYVEDELRLV
jgi:hypothetical protein